MRNQTVHVSQTRPRHVPPNPSWPDLIGLAFRAAPERITPNHISPPSLAEPRLAEPRRPSLPCPTAPDPAEPCQPCRASSSLPYQSLPVHVCLVPPQTTTPDQTSSVQPCLTVPSLSDSPNLSCPVGLPRRSFRTDPSLPSQPASATPWLLLSRHAPPDRPDQTQPRRASPVHANRVGRA
jgi:hypothetical protein